MLIKTTMSFPFNNSLENDFKQKKTGSLTYLPERGLHVENKKIAFF